MRAPLLPLLLSSLLLFFSSASIPLPLHSLPSHCTSHGGVYADSACDPPRAAPSVDISALPFPYTAVRGRPYNVSYDSRALLIDSQRVLLQSGIVHYPRSTPGMWPGLMRRLREANLNTVQTYVFWNYHEAVKGEWDWSTESRNLSHFLHLAASEGLFVNLRLGPYVCAEFAHGGLPAYLKAVPDLTFRAYNPAWLNATSYYLRYMQRWLQPHLPKNGGNVVLLQVENEYGDQAPNAYIEWLAELALELNEDMGVAFYVNNQPNAPPSILATKDSYNPVGFVNTTARVRHQPAMVVESYTGWFEPWYNAHSHRFAEDHSLAFGEFVAAGAAYYTYYMMHGGTNFAHWGGATPGVMGYIASYGYAAPISENGLPNPTKYVQTALLARALARYSSTIINSDYAWPLPLHNLSSSAPSNPSTLYSYTIGALGRNGSVVFLFNRHLSADGDVEVGGKRFRIPYWTLLLIDGLSLDVVYDSNTDSDPQYPMPWVDEAVQRRLFALRSLPSAVTYQPEPVGVQRVDAVTTQPLDQLMLVGYQSSYLVYSVNVSVTAEQVRRGAVTLTVTAANDFLFVWLGDAFQLSHPLIDSPTRLTLNTSGLSPGSCVLTLVTCAMGVDNYTPDPTKHKGLAGANVSLDSDLLTDGHHSWRHQRGLSLERRLSTRAQETWAPLPPIPPAWAWYRLTLTTPAVPAEMRAVAPPTPTYQLNLTQMGKGFLWVNGHEVSLYWLARAPADRCQADCNRTSTRGLDDPEPLCRTGCGDFYQRGLYHVPADWLSAPGEGNEVVLFEEWKEGVDPTQVALQFWQSTED